MRYLKQKDGLLHPRIHEAALCSRTSIMRSRRPGKQVIIVFFFYAVIKIHG